MKAPAFVFDNLKRIEIPLSILIPIRSHGNTQPLKDLVLELKKQSKNYSTVEILIIDDFSSIPLDINQENIKLLSLKDCNPSLSNSKNNKKEAIELGVNYSKNDYICCLDADVSVSENWLKAISQFIVENNPKFAAGIHQYSEKNSFLKTFLRIEQDNNTAISIGSLNNGFPTMCNGANMIFQKSAFENVEKYKGLYKINGGDDLFLFHRIFKLFPDKTFFIKSLDCAVFSETSSTFRTFISQRNRWLSKSFNYELPSVSWQLSLAFLMNLEVIILLFNFSLNHFLIIGIKIGVDCFFLNGQKSFFNSKSTFLNLLIMDIIYPFYVFTIGFYAIWHKFKTNYIPLRI